MSCVFKLSSVDCFGRQDTDLPQTAPKPQKRLQATQSYAKHYGTEILTQSHTNKNHMVTLITREQNFM